MFLGSWSSFADPRDVFGSLISACLPGAGVRFGANIGTATGTSAITQGVYSSHAHYS